MTALLTEVQTADALVKIAHEQVEAFNTGDWARLRAGLASDARLDELGTERKIDSPELIVEVFKSWKRAFPDGAGTVTSAVAQGDTVALEVTWTGTHTGPLMTAQGTIEGSGKRQETPAAMFLTFEDDKIKENRHYFDSLTLLKQIGVLPK